MAHAFMSPSAFKTARKCPASPLRQFQINQRMALLEEAGPIFYGLTDEKDLERWKAITNEDRTASEDGTKLHNVLEKCLLDRIADKDEIRQLIVEQDLKGDMKGDEYILSQLKRIVDEQLEMLSESEMVGVEKRIKVIGLPQFGTVDLTFKIDKTLYVRDLKTGRIEVEADENDQLMNYAVGVLDEIGWDDVDTVKFEILAVRFNVEEWECDTETLLKYKNEVMLPAFLAAYEINPKAVAGDHCLYCTAKVSCKEWQDKFKGAANQYFEDDAFTQLEPQEQVDLYRLCKQAEQAGKKLSKEILMNMEGFFEPVGVAKVNGRKRYDFEMSEEDLVKTLRKNKVITAKSDVYNTTLMSAKDLKAKYGDDLPEGAVREGNNAPYLKMVN